MEISYQGNTHDVFLSRDGDHIVTKHNKRDALHGYPVECETRTWAKVVEISLLFNDKSETGSK